MPDTLFSALLDPLRKRSSQSGIFLDTDDEVPSFLSYPCLYRKILGAAYNFRSFGIAKGTKVMFPFATSGDAIAAFLALIWIGAIPLAIKAPPHGDTKQAKEYAHYLLCLLKRFAVSIVIDAEGIARVPMPASVRRIPVLTESLGHDGFNWTAPDAEDIAFVQFSSGTTNDAKGVAVSHAQLIAQLKMITAQDGRTKQDVGANWQSLYHDMGLIVSLLSSLYVGHNLYVCPPARFWTDPIAWLFSLSDHAVSITTLSHFGLVYLLKKLQNPELDVCSLRKLNLTRLRHIYLSGATMDAYSINRLAEQLAPYGLDRAALTPCYGMAETVLMVACQSRTHDLTLQKQQEQQKRLPIPQVISAVSVGRLLPGFDIKVMRADGAVAEIGEHGELWLCGGTLCNHYFEDETSMLDKDGFYHTGDMGYIEEGSLFITGRMGEHIHVDGQNYYLSHLENTLQTHPELRSGGAVIIPSSEGLVVLADPHQFRSNGQLSALRAELPQLLQLMTGLLISVENVIFVRHGQLKYTSCGKLQRHLVSKALAQRKLKIYELDATEVRTDHLRHVSKVTPF